MERGPEMVAGLLATFAAGCGYVPLDANFPDSRLAFMLEDSGACFLLTQGDLETSFVGENTTVIPVADISGDSQARLPKPDLDRTAYVLYTSGSTGKPKGVHVVHRTVAGFLFGIREVLDFQQGDRVFATTTIAFDISIQDLFLPLITGATVVVAEESLAADGVRLSQALANHGLSYFQATPATWRLLSETGWSGQKGLHVLSGGEALDAPLAKWLLENNASLHNLYGPTETTIWTSVQKIEHDSNIALGRPLANVSYYLLDKSGHPVPPGVPAELHIGGSPLALGYHGRPALTALHFVPDHLSGKPGVRLYRSGDQVRFQSCDDRIEFIGRGDRQIKLRGFRVELGEVESHLLDLAAVASAVVLLSNEHPDQRLVAYVVAHERIPTTSRLREELSQRLPAYMIPAHFVFLDVLPLTANGKIDRGALPTPKWVIPKTAVASRNPEEELLATIWAQALNLKNVPLDVNFFELGGHSLLAARVIASIRKDCAVNLPLSELFEAPGISALAPKLSLLRREQNEGEKPILPVVEHGPMPLSPAQQRLFLIHEMGQTNGARILI